MNYNKMTLNQLRNQWAKWNLSTMINNRAAPIKPPNIIIQTECKQHFEKMKALLDTALESDRYTIHHLGSDKFSQGSWKKSCCLLMYRMCDQGGGAGGPSVISAASKKLILSYMLECDGSVMFFSTSDSSSNVKLEDLGFFDKEADSDQSNLLKNRCVVINEPVESLTKSDLVFILSRLGISGTKSDTESAEKTLLTPAYFLSMQAKKVEDIFQVNCTEESKFVSGKDITITFHGEVGDLSSLTVDDNNLPVIIIPSSDCLPVNPATPTDIGSFDVDAYKSKIQTRELGQNIVFTDTMTSTQTIMTGLYAGSIQDNGIVFHAKRQLKGKGRSGNQWLSPPGCMMFSMQMSIPLESFLGQNLTMMQHLVIVAFVRYIKRRGGGYEALDLDIKWPNDVYINKTVKIGGIVVNSSLWQKNFRVTIGLGVNISNEKPTDCLNSLIRSHNLKHGSDLKELGIEDALAGTLNEIEQLVDIFQRDGVEAFKQEYYQYWLHSNTEVSLECHNMEKADIIGVDNFGYLLVKLKKTGTIVTLQPDGNSFDMMRNMIIAKS